MQKKIIILGAGIGGLALGCRLASHGYPVAIYEMQSSAGGRALTLNINDQKFDSGPTIIRMPFMFDNIFSNANKNREDYFSFSQIDPAFKFIDSSGKFIQLGSNYNDNILQLAQLDPKNKEYYHHYLEQLRYAFHNTYLRYINLFPDQLSEKYRLSANILKKGLLKNVSTHITQHFSEKFTKRIFSYYPIANGLNPLTTPYFLSPYHFIDQEWGIAIANGGFKSIINGLRKLFQELNGQLYTSDTITEILSDGNLLTGIRLHDSKIIRGDIFVNNMDPIHFYKQLLKNTNPNPFAKYPKKQNKAGISTFAIYLLTKCRYNDIGLIHHNILFNRNYGGSISSLFANSKHTEPPYIHVQIPSLADNTLTNPENEMLIIQIPVPNLSANLEWKFFTKKFRDHILSQLEKYYIPDLKSNILAEKIITPQYYQNTLNTYLGSSHSTGYSLRNLLMNPVTNKSRAFSNLYHVGDQTHPGSNLIQTLTSARITENLIISEHW